MNDLRQRLAAGQCLLGSWVNTASPIVAELMAAAGFDFLTVDAEHSAVDLPQAQAIFQAIRSGNPGCTPLIRLPGVDYAQTKRYLDAGAAGVIAPLVNTAEQAGQLVEAVKYPPQGRRGVGFCRANRYGMAFDEYIRAANERTLTCVQIEHVEGVENIDAILDVEGIDAVFVGPYDLTASMGITAQFDHPDLADALERIFTACREHGKVAGVHVVQPIPEEVLKVWRDGFRLIAYSLDITMLHRACVDGLEHIRRGIEGETT